MDNLIIILIIVIYGVYKIVNRICENKELLESDDSDIYNILGKVIDENRELWQRLLRKEEGENFEQEKR